MRLEEHIGDIYMPPFKRGFYFMALLETQGNTQISFNEAEQKNIPTYYLVLQSPNLTYSFYRDSNTKGYLVYFKLDAFDFFRPEFQKEFPFFDALQTNSKAISLLQFKSLSTEFEGVFKGYENPYSPYNIAAHKLLALLYLLKNDIQILSSQTMDINPNKTLFFQFIQLVHIHYLDIKNIGDYAQKLSISPGHLSKVVKQESNQTARYFINQRIIKEAKSLLVYTSMDVSEIAYQLGFVSPSHFGRFFKVQTNESPLQYRLNHVN
ncbi:helix-turn-helix domain-containing protein [Myroides odoratus]|uniref:helix-turn-helix domain-containing protein n=1 Tax=Myroides odoratus TaxID=256 RepID=UPI00333FF0DF